MNFNNKFIRVQSQSLGFIGSSFAPSIRTHQRTKNKVQIQKREYVLRSRRQKINHKKKRNQKNKQRNVSIKLTNTNESCAIIIGIEYVNYAKKQRLDRLLGCHADALNIKALLKAKYSIQDTDINLLLDLPGYIQPTFDNILNTLKTVLSKSNYKNIFFIYSGHGSGTINRNSSEPDQQNESIVPCNFLEKGLLIDDTLRNYLIQYLGPTTNFISIFDSCHSGSILDLPKIISTGSNQFIVADKTNYYTSKNGQIISLSACNDNQTATSTIFGSKWQGALCHSLNIILNKSPFISFSTLLNQLQIEVNRKLGFDQKSSISINNGTDINQLMFPYSI